MANTRIENIPGKAMDHFISGDNTDSINLWLFSLTQTIRDSPFLFLLFS